MTRDRNEWMEHFAEGNFWDAVFEPFAQIMGMSVFAMVVGTVLVLALYSWTGNFFTPAIVLGLFGGLMIAAAPPQVAFIGVLMVAVALAIAVLSIWGDN